MDPFIYWNTFYKENEIEDDAAKARHLLRQYEDAKYDFGRATEEAYEARQQVIRANNRMIEAQVNLERKEEHLSKIVREYEQVKEKIEEKAKELNSLYFKP